MAAASSPAKCTRCLTTISRRAVRSRVIVSNRAPVSVVPVFHRPPLLREGGEESRNVSLYLPHTCLVENHYPCPCGASSPGPRLARPPLPVARMSGRRTVAAAGPRVTILRWSP